LSGEARTPLGPDQVNALHNDPQKRSANGWSSSSDSSMAIGKKFGPRTVRSKRAAMVFYHRIQSLKRGVCIIFLKSPAFRNLQKSGCAVEELNVLSLQSLAIGRRLSNIVYTPGIASKWNYSQQEKARKTMGDIFVYNRMMIVFFDLAISNQIIGIMPCKNC
jgi:hypothetical protein